MYKTQQYFTVYSYSKTHSKTQQFFCIYILKDLIVLHVLYIIRPNSTSVYTYACTLYSFINTNLLGL